MTWIVLAVLVLLLAWYIWNYYSIRRSAGFLENADFKEKLRQGQLIDIREATAYQSKHIMGARNIPASQFAQSLSAIRKDKPILLYGSSRTTATPRVIKLLVKQGYREIYVLRNGIEYWDGKVKQG